MTNKEALTGGVLDGINVSDIRANKALLDAGMDAAADYTPAGQKAIDLAAVSILQSCYTDSISEGGFSVRYSREAIRQKLLALANQYGLKDVVPGPKLSNATNRW